jgi:hypothetical protein
VRQLFRRATRRPSTRGAAQDGQLPESRVSRRVVRPRRMAVAAASSCAPPRPA